MPMDHNPERRRGHYHRSRRGPDRRGADRRTPPQEPGGRDQVDVEQIMRDIRNRIAQRHGIELSNQQIQELAARRLEAILDPRGLEPALLEQLRRSTGSQAGRMPAAAAVEAPYVFEDTTLYESHRGLLRFMRKLLNPILKLFFNPNPLIRALNIQARLNREFAEREAERDQRQAEWNALHYELVQRMVTELSRASLELNAQSLRIESLSAKVDFSDRRVRAMEGALHQARPSARAPESVAAVVPAAEPSSPDVLGEGVSPEGARRKRRRRRGRRGAGPAGEGFPGDAAQPASDAAVAALVDLEGDAEGDAERVAAEPAAALAAQTGEPAEPAPESATPEGEMLRHHEQRPLPAQAVAPAPPDTEGDASAGSIPGDSASDPGQREE